MEWSRLVKSRLQLALLRLLPRFLRRNVAHRLEYVAVRLVEWLLLPLGIDGASALMGRLWRWFAPFNARHARADRHLALAFPEKTAAERRLILGDMWENLGRTAAETVLLPRLLRETERVECTVPTAELERARTGAIFVSLHSGNWEVVSLPLYQMGIDLIGVYKPLSNPLVESYLLARRLPIYRGGLIGRERGVALKLRARARAGSTLAILADQTDQTSIPVTFFGRRARAMPFPAMLARRLGLPLFVGRCVRTGGARFRIEGRWLDVPRTDDPEADIAALTGAVHEVWEAWIRQYPAQWMWAHRKWL